METRSRQQGPGSRGEGVKGRGGLGVAGCRWDVDQEGGRWRPWQSSLVALRPEWEPGDWDERTGVWGKQTRSPEGFAVKEVKHPRLEGEGQRTVLPGASQ